MLENTPVPQKYGALPSKQIIRLVMDEKASSPTLIIFSGIRSRVILLHPEKALSPIVSILSARVILVRLTHPLKALLPRLVTPCSTVICLTFSRYSYQGTMVESV